MGDRRALRALVTGLAVGVVIACAACTETGGGPGPTTGSAAATGAVAGSGGFKGGYDPSTKFTQLTAMFLTTPAPVEMTDGKVHLTYELVLTNAAPIPFQVDKIELHDAATSALVPNTTGRVDITPLAVGTEAEGTTDPGAGNTSATIPPGTTYVAWVDVVFPQRSAVPTTIEHLVTGAVMPPNGPPVPAELRIGRTDTATDGPVVLGAPVPPGIWYMSEGCCADDTHHRRGLGPINGELSVPQRFAIDFYKLDEQHRTWVGDPSKLESFLTYRVPILSAAAGTVVAALDGFANTTALPNPPKPPPINETVGNHVIVKVAEGVYVLYAHMDPGSVGVRVGDQVTRGQQLGLIGSSGNSTTPHLHFQILTLPTYFPADSKPFAFDSFTLLGRVPDRIWDDNMALEPTGTLPFTAATPTSPHTNELPLDRDVVQFGP
ncbi:MAG TPA: M23 family metallopeptidase [Lapillicoccus sp.]|nr:M23 family metallopeptidase [Lapillicoccus sp.]